MLSDDPWCAMPGETLRAVVSTWARRAGYECLWSASYDYPVHASLQFQGDFIQALSRLFDGYQNVPRPFTVDVYQEQKLVHVAARDG